MSRAKGAGARPRRGMVNNHYVALAGLVGLGLVALMMLRGQLDLVGGGKRAAAVLGAVLLVERVLLPLGRALVGPARPSGQA